MNASSFHSTEPIRKENYLQKVELKKKFKGNEGEKIEKKNKREKPK